jgi:hypothetical protein
MRTDFLETFQVESGRIRLVNSSHSYTCLSIFGASKAKSASRFWAGADNVEDQHYYWNCTVAVGIGYGVGGNDLARGASAVGR